MIVVKIAYSYTTPVIKVTYDVTEVNVSGGDPSPIYVNLDYNASGAATLLTSVGLSMPTGFSVANSPLVQSGTLAVSFANGYSLPTDAEQAEWDTAYDRSLTAASVSGTTTKTLTLTKQDGSTLQTSWSDIDTGLTSVGISVPTGLQVSNSPLTSNGTIAISYGSGYSIPTDAKQTQWDAAYNDKINSASVTGTSTKTLTLTQQDGGTIQASWSDIDTGLTSVGLSMPSAFSVSNTPLTSNGTIAVTGAGTASQYVRGDGQLADFPNGGGGGGASVSYYLNGSVSQGTFGGNTYYEMNKTPVIGTGTDFNISGDGYIAQFITDAADPSSLLIPGGNWNFEMYFSASSMGGTPNFHLELYKYDGTTFTQIANNSSSPELIAFGTTINAYFAPLAVPETVLGINDRLALRVYVQHSGRTITLHTEDNHLCQIITTFTTGLTALNGLTKQVQYFATGTSGSDFAISSVTDTHTFNLPTASSTKRGALSSADWSTFNAKLDANSLIDCGTW